LHHHQGEGFVLTDPDVGTAVGGDGVVLRTTDGGVTWTPQGGIPGTISLLAVTFLDNDIGTTVGETGHVYRTTDGGDTWTPQESGVNEVLTAVSFSDANHGMAVGYLGNALRTTDGGATWIRQNSKTFMNLQGVHFVDADIGMMVGVGGIILRTTTGGATTVGVEAPVAYPVRHLLEQNYPNPFHTSTRIGFTLPAGALAAIRVYDVLGREVAVLSNEVLTAGYHEVEWQADGFPSGVYLCRLQACAFNQAIVLSLIK
jgi:photosystem II stability/assembly factor-like uncharacterized protein